MGINIRRKEKIGKTAKFTKRIKKVQKEVGVALRKTQEEMKQQTDKERKETKEYKVEDKMMLSTKDLVFKEQLAKKLVDQYVGSYIIDEVVSTNAVKL